MSRPFAASMSAEVGDEAQRLESAEGLIGGRIRAPEGGCRCDALIESTAPTSAPATTSAAVTPGTIAPAVSPNRGALVAPATIRPATPFEVVPGDVLLFEDDINLSDHVHQAIVRNASEMIATNEHGVVEALAIPWHRAVGRR